jgi:flagellar assembly protein FliH
MSGKFKKMPAGPTRIYRFPPLAGDSGELGAQSQFEFGYQQGQEQGLEQGYQDGLEQGKQAGYQDGLTQGTEEGHRLGVEQGLRQGEQRFELAIQPFSSLQQQWESLCQTRLQEQTSLLAQVVSQVARRVIQAEFTLNPELVMHQVKQALTSLPSQPEELVIYLNDADRRRLADLGMNECEGWPIQSDPALGIGDCRVECRNAVIEAKTEERLEQCLAEVGQALERGNA